MAQMINDWFNDWLHKGVFTWTQTLFTRYNSTGFPILNICITYMCVAVGDAWKNKFYFTTL